MGHGYRRPQYKVFNHPTPGKTCLPKHQVSSAGASNIDDQKFNKAPTTMPNEVLRIKRGKRHDIGAPVGHVNVGVTVYSVHKDQPPVLEYIDRNHDL